jgi:hypothetical protein
MANIASKRLDSIVETSFIPKKEPYLLDSWYKPNFFLIG